MLFRRGERPAASVTRLPTAVDSVCVAARRIALEGGHNRVVADYAAAAARIHLTGAESPMAPMVATAVLALPRRPGEHLAQYAARVRRNPIAAIVAAALADTDAVHR